MASDIKISQMPSATSLEGSELIPIVQNGTNKSTTVSKIKEGLATSEQLENKVDKDGTKVLSEKNFTAAYETKLKSIADNANNYVHPTTSGNKHIPSGGSSGQILRWSEDGTAVWGADNNTTYSAATSSTLGLVKQGAAVEDATSAEDIVTQFNALLASLRTSGAIATGAAAASTMSMNVAPKSTTESVTEFVPPMPLEKGKLYIENGIVYRCTQTSKLSISNKLSDLIGHYVEIV